MICQVFKKKFYSKYGYCWELRDYKLKTEMKILARANENFTNAHIYLTDKLLSTKPALDISNHRGNIIELNTEHILLKLKSNLVSTQENQMNAKNILKKNLKIVLMMHSKILHMQF